MQKIGLMGGTFDPIHNGHLALAESAYRSLALDGVIFIPAFQPPHKGTRRITPVALRMAMITCAIAGKAYFSCSDIEARQKRVVYTIETLRMLRAAYPPATQFFFLVGSDFLREYHTWQAPDELTTLATFVIAPRPGFSVNDVPAGMLVLPGTFPAIAASDIRSKLASSPEIAQWVPPTVLSYIREHSLYCTEAV